MRNFKHKMAVFMLLSLLTITTLTSVSATIAFSGDSKQSLSVSSNRTENSFQYLIEIDISGVDTSKVTFEVEYQTLYLLASSGSVITNSAISGAQVIRLAYDFPTNAVLKNYFRVNHPNKIIISIPKA